MSRSQRRLVLLLVVAVVGVSCERSEVPPAAERMLDYSSRSKWLSAAIDDTALPCQSEFEHALSVTFAATLANMPAKAWQKCSPPFLPRLDRDERGSLVRVWLPVRTTDGLYLIQCDRANGSALLELLESSLPESK